eukprot:3611550-Pyramimonas_sp.AAC.1
MPKRSSPRTFAGAEKKALSPRRDLGLEICRSRSVSDWRSVDLDLYRIGDLGSRPVGLSVISP